MIYYCQLMHYKSYRNKGNSIIFWKIKARRMWDIRNVISRMSMCSDLNDTVSQNFETWQKANFGWGIMKVSNSCHVSVLVYSTSLKIFLKASVCYLVQAVTCLRKLLTLFRFKVQALTFLIRFVVTALLNGNFIFN